MVYYFLFLEKSGWSLSIFFSFSTLALLKLRFLRKSYLRQALAVQTVKFLKLSTLLAEERRVIGKCIYNFFYVFVSVISIGNPNKNFRYLLNFLFSNIHNSQRRFVQLRFLHLLKLEKWTYLFKFHTYTPLIHGDDINIRNIEKLQQPYGFYVREMSGLTKTQQLSEGEPIPGGEQFCLRKKQPF